MVKNKNWAMITKINKARKSNSFKVNPKTPSKYTAVVYEDGGYYELSNSYGSKKDALRGIDNYVKRFPRMKNKSFKIIEEKDFYSYGVNTKR